MEQDTTLEPVKRMSRDIALAAKTLSAHEARFLVDAYYMMQDDRKRAHNQVRALGENAEPNAVLSWLAVQSETLEAQIKRALDQYTGAHEMGAWMRQVVGIGPVISAGLLAHIDMEPWRCMHTKRPNPKFSEVNGFYDSKAVSCKESAPHGPECHRQRLETMGHILAFGGHDPNVKWNKGERRPWNAALKVIFWKAGQSFMKFSGRDDCYYGKVYLQRKAYEIARNDRGDMAATAAQILQEKNFGKATEAYKHLITGKLPPAQIDARARRYAVKIFISHLHETWYRQKFGKAPPKPYPIAILGHAHYIPPPN